jgi:hypothetical protein
VALIAKFTGWTEQYILWELPMARGNAYCHAFMRLENVATEPADANDELMQMIDEI